MALLEVRKLSKYFGGLAAIVDLDLDVQQGEIVGLIGPNGSGKTTLFNVVTGVFPPTGGKIVFDHKDITGWKPHRVAQLGLIRTFQLTSLFHDYTALQNVLVAKHMEAKVNFWGAILNTPGRRHRDQEMMRKAKELLELTELTPFELNPAGTLSSGWQKSLVVAVALAAGPRLLLLDEPVTTLAPDRVTSIMRLISRARDAGTTVILVEHNLAAIMGYCDRIVVMNFGRKIAEGPPEQVRQNPQVVEAYMGR